MKTNTALDEAVAPAVTPEHILALHKHLDEVKNFVVSELHKALEFIKTAAPVVETVGSAVVEAIPGAGNVVAAVEKAAGAAAAIASCCVHATAPHGPNGCTAAGCSCSSPAAR